jgi:hypothetical protein
LIITVSLLLFTQSLNAVHLYHLPYALLQHNRESFFSFFCLSVGDVLYIVAGIWLLVTLVKWGKYMWRFKTDKLLLLRSFLKSINVILLGYLFFLFGWGVNYYNLPLRAVWQLKDHNDTLDLVQFDSLLVSRLNALAPAYRSYDLDEINAISTANYSHYIAARVSPPGVKPTLFGWYMDRVGIEGYFNPFTGEGQVVSTLPAFLLPFTVSHEMAHQTGIAAEGDANLMAYALCTMCSNPSFNYSGNLNLWLYVNARLSRKDSVTAQRFENQLNKLTQAHIDTIEQREKLSDNDAHQYSNNVYDGYLKMQQQKEGIRSYGSVTANAWLLEKKRLRDPMIRTLLKMP